MFACVGCSGRVLEGRVSGGFSLPSSACGDGLSLFDCCWELGAAGGGSVGLELVDNKFSIALSALAVFMTL